MASNLHNTAAAAHSDDKCPLCGGDNACAIAAGKPADTCWCQTVTLSPEALSAIPEPSIGKHCICANCGRVSTESQHAR